MSNPIGHPKNAESLVNRGFQLNEKDTSDQLQCVKI
jgi:hypothetical protein